MATAPSSAQARPRFGARVRTFWTRVTEGLELEQLWGQFKSEARAGYDLYSRDVDWDALRREPRKGKRVLLTAWRSSRRC